MVSPAILQALKRSALVIVGFNTAGFAVTAVTRSHKITDLTGTTAFIASAWATHAAACHMHNLRLFQPSKSLFLAGAVTLWGTRLAGYLFWRVLQTGKDARLNFLFPRDESEPLLTGRSMYPIKLAGFWTAQSLWGWIVLLPITVSQTLTPAAPLGPLGWIAAAGFLAGFAIETVADLQKFYFKSAHPDKFMDSGLFALCRHPNYFGEILLWTSLTVLAGTHGVFAKHPWIIASPAFTIFLLLYVSGIPTLEKSHEKRYGKDAAYKDYKASTNLLLPWCKSKTSP
ncbi:DUF1295-domain-containing protein [Coccomyxa subellipsoidea C-169]|uniref:DUF1295-domain-containing protein n=1 Tax=Coccomyxa subellipsoidea (strain C-169) TaxID=574566 RepID=I0YVW6_COCSC|nr:DUF1295-domain-containing protein [Coccomyxa subellipsoidea C-169]EIE22535.1 DUF1295-domain-containing protein [Coccomyxa subellipsoidea C-169]|eukprot:XP_005647079.1 DUF1295-domain-containing protein [Coccomyxa subellipsoidea C-169]